MQETDLETLERWMAERREIITLCHLVKLLLL